MDIYVYHDDDYADNGGIGLAVFKTRESACAFIMKRMETSNFGQKLESYTVIEGKELKIATKNIITSIALK